MLKIRKTLQTFLSVKRAVHVPHEPFYLSTVRRVLLKIITGV